MMVKSIGIKNSGLLRLVEERLSTKKKHQQVPYLPKDCISNILVLLPLESLQRSRFVCKPWYNIIENPKFVDAHLHRSESVLIFLSPIPIESLYPFSMVPTRQEKPKTVSVESLLLQQNSIFNFSQPVDSPKFYVQFLKLSNGKSEIGEYNLSCFGNIRATCNGLILLDNKLKKGGVIVLNPVTRKLFAPRVGTLCLPQNESYGIALNDATGEYKVVHLFRDQLGFVNCEILSLWTKTWREINGPAKWREVRRNAFGSIGSFGYGPVSAIGALHWIPHIDRMDYIVSLEVDSEKFHQIPLPKSGRRHDRIVEMGGFLSFVIREDVNHIDIWTLKGLCGEVWTKNHSITVASIKGKVPLLSLRIKGDLIFRRRKDDSFYVYDFQFQEMRKVKMVKGCIPGPSATYLPHVNSLVSWMDTSQNMFD